MRERAKHTTPPLLPGIDACMASQIGTRDLQRALDSGDKEPRESHSTSNHGPHSPTTANPTSRHSQSARRHSSRAIWWLTPWLDHPLHDAARAPSNIAQGRNDERAERRHRKKPRPSHQTPGQDPPRRTAVMEPSAPCPVLHSTLAQPLPQRPPSPELEQPPHPPPSRSIIPSPSPPQLSLDNPPSRTQKSDLPCAAGKEGLTCGEAHTSTWGLPAHVVVRPWRCPHRPAAGSNTRTDDSAQLRFPDSCLARFGARGAPVEAIRKCRSATGHTHVFRSSSPGIPSSDATPSPSQVPVWGRLAVRRMRNTTRSARSNAGNSDPFFRPTALDRDRG